MNNTTAKVSHDFQQDTATAKVFHCERFALYSIPCQSLLLSIIVLNDICDRILENRTKFYTWPIPFCCTS